QHVEVIGIEGQQVAEEMAGAEQLQQDLQRTGAVLEQVRQSTGAGRIAEEAFEVVQRLVRIGRARQDTAERRAEIAQSFRTEGSGEVLVVAPAAVEIAESPGLQ